MYDHSERLVSGDKASGLETTRSALKSAMITLADFDGDFHEDPENEPSLDDSGIEKDCTENDEGSLNCEVDPSTELGLLRKKIAEMEKENEQLKVQLKTSEYAGKFVH